MAPQAKTLPGRPLNQAIQHQAHYGHGQPQINQRPERRPQGQTRLFKTMPHHGLLSAFFLESIEHASTVFKK